MGGAVGVKVEFALMAPRQAITAKQVSMALPIPLEAPVSMIFPTISTIRGFMGFPDRSSETDVIT